MAREHRLTPSASSLSESMRDLGYSLETAIADIVDNSISAGAREIEILCDLTAGHPTLAIIDNGCGMSEDNLLIALRHGAVNPKQIRPPKDLGRFGLGMKTASFSQCRRLTVASSKKGQRSCAEWNLALVDEKDDWLVSVLDEDEICALPFVNKLQENGTIVIWRDLDRLFEGQSGQKRDEVVNEKLDLVEKHLALVFHRFLSGEARGWKKISMTINGHVVEPFDPFCKKHPATQVLPEEIVQVAGSAVQMQPYVLPHHSRLSAKEYDFYLTRSDFISNQGVYIYRNSRLMAWGDWFRLIPKGEATKLARVQIDFPNSLDESWEIDIKKSRARPPRAVRERLHQIIDGISSRSINVHQGRGKKLFLEIRAPLWERYADRGRVCYTVNMGHPLVDLFRETLPPEQTAKLDTLLDTVASSLPVEMIYSDFSTRPQEMSQAFIETDTVIERLNALKETLSNGSIMDEEIFREVMRSTRLFEHHQDIVEKYIRESFR